MSGDLHVGSAETYLPASQVPQAEWDRAMVALGDDAPTCERCGKRLVNHPWRMGDDGCDGKGPW